MNTPDDLARQKRNYEEQIFRDHGAEMGHTPTPADGSGPEVLTYISALKVGERVIEITHSAMYGIAGTVYESKRGGGTCVMWDMPDGNKMGTSVTWGTRRIKDVFESVNSHARLIAQNEAMKSALENTQSFVSLMYSSIPFKKEIQDHLPYGVSDQIKAAALKDSLGIRAALNPPPTK